MLCDAPRWVLLAALVFAPWFYGGTTEEGIVAITWWLTAAVALWTISFAFRVLRTRAAAGGRDSGVGVPMALAVPSLLLLAFGWWMVLNATAVYDADFAMFVRLRNLASVLPGSADQAVSAAAMWRATVLLGTIGIVVDACRESVWLMRFCATAAATGGSIALLGLLQKASGAPMIFWRAVDQPVTTFFATFFYHGNAGAFLSMTLPVTIGLAVRAFTIGRDGALARAVWPMLAIVSIIAAFANTSRMGHAVAFAILVVIAAVLLLRSRRAAGRINWRTGLAAAIALSVVGYAVIKTAGIERSLGRWERAGEIIPLDARWAVAQTALRAVPEAGPSGFGPGTFHVVFPYFTGEAGERVKGFWRHLHQDYIQTLLEWGWFGAALWGVVFGGGIVVALRSRLAARAATWRPRQRMLLPLVALGLGAVALHATVDFPLQIASIQLYAAVYVGICWSATTWESSTTAVRRRNV